MIQYDSFRDSGIEWLGDIPEHWRNYRIDLISTLVRGNTGFKKDELLNKGEYVALQYGKTYKVDEVNDSFKYFVNSGFYKKNQVVNFGNTILISTSETIHDLGHSCFYNRDDLGLIGGEQILLKPSGKLVIGKYLFYYSKKFCIELQKYATGLKVFRFNIDDLKQISVAIPLLKQQKVIVQYLDAKTQAIDKKVSLFEQKINKYKELRKSLINQTITKGLNPDVKFKKSCLDGIGEIPEYWDSVRMKDIGFLYSGLSGKSGKDFDHEDVENSKHYVPFTNVASNTYVDTKAFGLVSIGEKENQNKIKKNDLFFMMSSEGYEDVGKAALLDEEVPSETYLNSFCKGFRITSKNVVPKFLNWLLYSSVYRENLLVQGKGFTRINLKMNKINDFEIIIPKTCEEQTQIADYLDDKTQQIDTIVKNIEKQVDTLSELRKTLINDVVTGKIKVTA